MKLSREIVIEASADKIWDIIGTQFVPVENWMASIKSSVEKTTGQKVAGAPVIGRICAIGAAAGKGLSLDETITKFDEPNKILCMNTDIIGLPSVAPIKGYTSEVIITPIGPDKCNVTWTSVAALGIMGYVMYFIIKKSLSNGFYRNLEEMKPIIETGKPHPRKQAAFDKEALTGNLQSA